MFVCRSAERLGGLQTADGDVDAEALMRAYASMRALTHVCVCRKPIVRIGSVHHEGERTP